MHELRMHPEADGAKEISQLNRQKLDSEEDSGRRIDTVERA